MSSASQAVPAETVPTPPVSPSNPLLDFSERELLAAYQQGDYADMSRRFLAVLNHCGRWPAGSH